jgi:hypothetical protein
MLPFNNAKSCSCKILVGNLANQQYHFAAIFAYNGGRSSGIYSIYDASHPRRSQPSEQAPRENQTGSKFFRLLMWAKRRKNWEKLEMFVVSYPAVRVRGGYEEGRWVT